MVTRRPPVVFAAMISVVVASLLASSCSSSGSSKHQAGNAPPSTGASGGMSVSQAQAAVQSMEKRPTSIGLTTPVGKPIPSGKTVAFISCGPAPTCAANGVVAQEAAKLLGWNVKIYNTDGTPTGVQGAWQAILQSQPRPVGVVWEGLPPEIMQPQLAQAKSEGIFTAACCVTNPSTGAPDSGNGLVDYNDFPNQPEVLGPALATYVDAVSHGKGQAVFVGDSYPITTADGTAFMADLKKLCPGCSSGFLNIPTADVGGPEVAPLIIGYLQAHPSTKYVVMASDGGTDQGLPAALKNAGLGDVTLTGNGPVLSSLQYIKQGGEASAIYFPYYELMYADIDAIARHVVGASQQPPLTPPVWLLVKGNIPPTTTGFFPEVENLNAIFATLWGKQS